MVKRGPDHAVARRCGQVQTGGGRGRRAATWGARTSADDRAGVVRGPAILAGDPPPEGVADHASSSSYRSGTVSTEVPPTQREGPSVVAAQGWLESLDGTRGLYRLVLIILTVAVGAVAAFDPRIAAVAVIVAVVGIGLLVVGAKVTQVFLGALAIMLVGYAFFGRGFAYVGVAPLYLGELALPIALLAMLQGRQRARFQPLHVVLLAFMGWGAMRTIPYIGVYGIDALRDAVTWGYAAFAIAVSLVLTASHLRVGLDLYRRFIPWFLVWVPLAGLLTEVLTLPTVPGSDVPIVVFKGGDAGVHLAGIAAFILLGLYAKVSARWVPETLIWALWLFALAVAGILNRAGFVAALMSAATVLYIRTAGRWLALIFVGFALLVPLVLIDPRIKIDTVREISVSQMVDNVISVFSETDDPGLEGTKSFRLRWWAEIVDYTVGGPHFWTGKGYGINLAEDDGFQATESLRAPHNAHIEVLARSGVPGLILWIVLHAAYGLSLLRAAARARTRGDVFWVQVLGFVFIYWLAAMFNASFDPYLQGPQGGIWFWTMFGVGLAAIRMSDGHAGDRGVDEIDGDVVRPAKHRGLARPTGTTLP